MRSAAPRRGGTTPLRVAAAVAAVATALLLSPRRAAAYVPGGPSDLEVPLGLPNCTEHWIRQNVDHFGYDASTGSYMQRYFTYDGFIPKNSAPKVVFFYCGNEDNVELYVNNTGLMWTLGEKMGALLVFAEHRYYGESIPTVKTGSCMRFLTTEQATADYAQLIHELRAQWGDPDRNVPVVGFGGSYGGMLGSWMRMRYPDALDGMIAASAPILSFEGLEPPYDPSTFDIIVTRDAGGRGSGAAPACADNARAAWPLIEKLAGSASGRATLSKAFMTCRPLATQAEAVQLISWAQAPLAYMAMGNYPYPSDYMTHGDGKPMAAWPMRTACSHLATPGMGGVDLIEGLRKFTAVYYNRTGVGAPCFFNSAAHGSENGTTSFSRARRPMSRVQRDYPHGGAPSCTGTWDYQYCTQMVQPFAAGLGKDMFYPPSPWNVSRTVAGCLAQWGTQCRPEWASVGFPGSRLEDGRFSRIVFTNGYLDPWSGGGVLRNISEADDLLAFVLPNGAHHLDLMWPHPNDPADAIQARDFIAATIRRWVTEHYADGP